ncbi:MAG TPA: tetratricopeptide repeat protein [Longimicrobium sp.]
MPGRRQSAADLPRAPLELVHPLQVQGGAVAGAEILSDGLGPTAVLLFRLHRALLAWTLDPECPPAADRAELRRIEDAVLSRLRTDEIAAPLAVLAAALLDPEAADPKRLSWACFCVSDWATGREAKATALAFTQLAALVWPRHARYAWVVGRLMCAFGRVRESEPWFRRAHRVAVWTDDWEAQARSINSLGLVYFERGRFPLSKRLHLRAIKIAHRNSLREVEGIATHNLFVVHAEAGEAEAAEAYAGRAFELYGPTHPRLPEFATDVALFWNVQGFYSRALPIFLALRPHFTQPEERIRITAGIVRAAGGVGESELFGESWNEIQEFATCEIPGALIAGALYEAGIGAANLSRVDLATAAFTRALEIASGCGAAEMITEAELALSKLSCGETVDKARKRGLKPDADKPAERLAQEFVLSLHSNLIR